MLLFQPCLVRITRDLRKLYECLEDSEVGGHGKDHVHTGFPHRNKAPEEERRLSYSEASNESLFLPTSLVEDACSKFIFYCSDIVGLRMCYTRRMSER